MIHRPRRDRHRPGGEARGADIGSGIDAGIDACPATERIATRPPPRLGWRAAVLASSLGAATAALGLATLMGLGLAWDAHAHGGACGGWVWSDPSLRAVALVAWAFAWPPAVLAGAPALRWLHRRSQGRRPWLVGGGAGLFAGLGLCASAGLWLGLSMAQPARAAALALGIAAVAAIGGALAGGLAARWAR